MNPKLLAPLAIATLMLSCGPEPSGTPEQSELTNEQINAKLTEIIGTGLPEAATNVTVGQANLSASVFDCGFICPEGELGALIAASPRLSAAHNAAAEKPAGEYYLSTGWNASAPDGAQFVLIRITGLGGETIAVDIGTTFIPGVRLEE